MADRSRSNSAAPQGDRPEDLLVSVVIPAFNAADTLAETIESVRAQTHSLLEIIVVDDGSDDDTETIARRFADRDPRIRVLRIPHGGVAAARNAGIAAARSEFVAPIDADDLWDRDKIARQLKELCRGGEHMAYVYSGSRRIDADGIVISDIAFRDCRRNAFLQSIFTNFVGNGSSILFRRSAIEKIGGYSSELRAHGVEGTEDWLSQTLMARHWSVGVVPAALTGYRRRDRAMSANREQMLRSQLKAIEIAVRENPDTPRWVSEAARARMEVHLADWLVRRRRFLEAARALRSAFRRSPRYFSLAACERMLFATRRLGRGISRRGRRIERFDALDPDQAPGAPPWWDPLALMLRPIAEAERMLEAPDACPRQRAPGGSAGEAPTPARRGAGDANPMEACSLGRRIPDQGRGIERVPFRGISRSRME